MAGALSTAQICAIVNVAVPILLAVVGIAILALLYSSWLDRNNKKEGERLLREYEGRLAAQRAQHVPFQPRFRPGNL